jgi:hypothetical protein
MRAVFNLSRQGSLSFLAHLYQQDDSFLVNWGDSMTEKRKHAILLATVILTARIFPAKPLGAWKLMNSKRLARLLLDLKSFT